MLRPLWLAIGFLTRVPVPPAEADAAALARAAALFPLVGAGLGALAFGLALALAGRLPPGLVAALVLALLALVTGALHLDGLGDLADGLGGARGDRARMLEIMRDPRIGAHGAVALVLALLLAQQALAPALDRPVAWWCAWLAAARAAGVLVLACFKPATSGGLGRAFSGVGAPHAIIALAPVGALGALGACAVPCAAALAVSLGVAALAARRLGGITGDVCGAAIVVAEVAFLVSALAAPAWPAG